MKVSRRDLLIGSAGMTAGLMFHAGAMEIVRRRIYLDAELAVDPATASWIRWKRNNPYARCALPVAGCVCEWPRVGR